MAYKMFSLLSLLPAFIASGALATQQVVENSFFDQVNFTTLFAPSSFVDHKSGAATAWDTKTWGLTSYARTEPLRCFGNDGGALYDVAVIGTFHSPAKGVGGLIFGQVRLLIPPQATDQGTGKHPLIYDIHS